MFSVEEICKCISSNIAEELKLDQDQKSIVNYGLFAFIQTFFSILIVLICGLILNVAKEAMIISFVISILRKSSGGVHASSPGRCAAIGAIISCTMGILCKYFKVDLDIMIILGGIIFIWSYYMVYKLAPVDSISKPINKELKRKRLRNNSLKILTMYIGVIVINTFIVVIKQNERMINYNLCIYAGVIWQIFSLTKTGHLLMGKLDSLFIYISLRREV